MIDDEVPQAEKRPIEEDTREAKKSRLASIMQVMETSNAKKLVRQLEYEKGIFKTPVNHRRRRTNTMLEGRMDVAEV